MERSPVSAVGGILLYLFLVISCRFEVSAFSIVSFSGLLIVGTNLVRLWILKNAQNKFPSRIQAFNRYFFALIICLGMGWSLLISWVFINFPIDHFESQVAFIVVCANAASAMITFVANPVIFRSFLFFTLAVPVLTFCGFAHGRQAWFYIGFFTL